MVKYTKIYSGGIPEFKENDIFKTIIPLNVKNFTGDKLEITGDKIDIADNKIDIKNKIMEYLKINDFITTKIAMEILELKSKSWVREFLNKMVKDNILLSEGANKNRKYILKKVIKRFKKVRGYRRDIPSKIILTNYLNLFSVFFQNMFC